MNIVEREVLASLLSLTDNGETSCELICRKARIPMENLHRLLDDLKKADLITCKGNLLTVSSDQRIRLAVDAVKSGADFQRICQLLGWKEFEEIASKAFQGHGFYVSQNVRFKGKNGKRWEIDLLACKTPLIVSVDCKHWTQNWRRSAITKIVDSQILRSKSLAGIFPKGLKKIPCGIDANRENFTVFPLVLSLLSSPIKIHSGTPIVSILQLRSFLYDIPAQAIFLTHFRTNANSETTEMTRYL